MILPVKNLFLALQVYCKLVKALKLPGDEESDTCPIFFLKVEKNWGLIYVDKHKHLSNVRKN